MARTACFGGRTARKKRKCKQLDHQNERFNAENKRLNREYEQFISTEAQSRNGEIVLWYPDITHMEGSMRSTARLLLTLALIAVLLAPRAPQPIHRSGAWRALTAWAEERAWPHGRLPEQGYTRAWNKMRRDADDRSPKTASPWTPLGPINLAGRMLAVAVDPRNTDLIYAGSASGGL